jgi:hypothetical protein
MCRHIGVIYGENRSINYFQNIHGLITCTCHKNYVASYTLNQWTAGIKYASTFYPLGVRWSMVKELKKTAFKM